MAKSSLWSKKRKSKLIIIIPLILVAVASAIGIYSLKVYIALQEYFARMTDYNILVPEEAFFYYDNYLKVIIAFVIISFRSEEHTSELQSHSFISYAVFCLKKKNKE